MGAFRAIESGVAAARTAETVIPRLSSINNEAALARGAASLRGGSDAKEVTELAKTSANARSSSEGFRAALYSREEDSVSVSRSENVRAVRDLGSNNPYRPENLAFIQNSSRARFSDSLAGGRESASRGEESIFRGSRDQFAEDGATSIANTEGRGRVQSAAFAERAKVLEQKLKERHTLIKSATRENDNPVGDKVEKSFAEKTWKEKTAKERFKTVAPHLFTGAMFIGPEVGGEVQNKLQNDKIDRQRLEDKMQAAIDAKMSSAMSGLQEAFAVGRG